MHVAGYTGFSKIKLFFALSRTPHGLLDMCTPLLVALIWLGCFPSAQTILLGIVAAFGGYTAVYALNDIVDFRTDREKIRQADSGHDTGYLDGAMIRHPLARGYLSIGEAVGWAGWWAIVSLAAAYLLNPVCALILIIGCILETIYCLLLRITHLRVLVSGIVKTLGGLAAVFAVDATPQPELLLLVFCWLFFWEIGGQNIPADWHDIQEDTVTRARTVPVTFGPGLASGIALFTLVISVVLSGILFFAAPIRLHLPFHAFLLFTGIYLLIIPSLKLFRTRERETAAALFNRASWYPCSLLVIILVAILWTGNQL